MSDPAEYAWGQKLCDTSRATLFRAVRRADGVPVVIKLARSEDASPDDLARLRHEHALLSSLDLPGVVRAYGLLAQRDGVGLVLEDLGGTSLAELIRAGRPSLANALELALALAKVVESIHRRGILHKDLKPEHVFVDPARGTLKLIDFGLATRLAREGRPRIGVTSAEGTFAYMSPEQTGRMNRGIDQRSDLYSLGVTLYELFTGVLPFASADPLELVHSHIARQPASPAALRSDIPPVVAAIVLRLLAKEAEDRYQDAGGLVADLQRCLTALRAHSDRPIPDFPLGRDDSVDTLRMPQKLYGRDAETALLFAAFERARAGSAELLLLGGPSGVGKSALVQELQKELVRRGRFIAGKFDQLNRAQPYAPIVEACRELLASILAEPAELLERWAERLRAALGPNAGVIIDLVPELALVIGAQPPPIELDANAAQRRFELAFQRFIGVFTSAQHALVLFLDDLQWADAASLRLLHALLTAPERGHLLVLGAYRDNEVGPAHELTLALAALRKAGATVGEISLAPLGLADVQQWIADALRVDARRERPSAPEPGDIAPPAPSRRVEALSELAALALAKTGGNPFFLGQFLDTLAERRLLTYDREARAFRWDLPAIEQLMVSDNVLELLIARLDRLAPRARELLWLAACIGHRFDLDTLATVAEASHSDVAEALWEPLREGLLVPLDERYRYAAFGAARGNIGYEFLHDRVQQAAYSLIEPGERAAVHLRIGRMLRDRSAGGPDDNLFEIVNHLNLGASLLRDAGERLELARLNLRAGVRAHESAAHGVARKLLATCRTLLGDEGWQRDYATLYAASLKEAECEAASGDASAALALLEQTEQRAAPGLDRAAARRLRAAVLTQVNRMPEAVMAGVEAAAMLGSELPLEASALGPAVHGAFGAVQAALGGREIESLLALPVMTDPHALAAVQLFTTMLPSSFQTNPDLMALVLFKAVEYSLRYGNPPSAPHLYGTYALLYRLITGDDATAYRFGQLAVTLGERPAHRRSAGAGEMVFASFVSHWQRHISEALEHYQRGMRASLEVGDYLHFGYCAAHRCLTRLFMDGDLTELAAELRGYVAPLRNAGDYTSLSLVRATRRALEQLQGRKEESGQDELGKSAAPDNPTQLGMELIVSCMAHYLTGDLEAALADAERAEPLALYQRGMLWSVEQPFYRALTRAAAARTREGDARERLLAGLEQDERALAELARSAPANHAHKVALVAAERAALAGTVAQALEHYERAIALAREHGFRHHEGLASELYARFHHEQGRVQVARVYLLDAQRCYLRWGARAKLDQLAARYPELLAAPETGSHAQPSTFTSTETGLGRLDLATAVRVTQTIASELMLDKLTERLMRSLVEHAGAQRAFLLVAHGARLRVSAAVTVEPDRVQIGLDRELANTELAIAVAQYVARTRETVILADAARDRRFGADPYIVAAQPKSIMAVAMVHQGRLGGVLYLENNAAKGVFDPARIELSQFLAAQAATAIENAALYQQLEQRVADRTAELAASNARLEQSLRQLNEAQRRLMDMSRQAGMADVATSILHNVGNALNSINVSARLVAATLEQSNATRLDKLARLIDSQRNDLARFLSQDERGGRIPEYLLQLSAALAAERSSMRNELAVLSDQLQHVNAIVAMQMAHAKGGGMVEEVDMHALLEDAVRLTCGPAGIPEGELISVSEDLPKLALDRYKVLQILMNLLSNARDAVRGAADRTITLRCRRLDQRVAISVEDHGAGIAKENLDRVFSFGFTTKPDGQGYGLHASATAAAELGGTLRCASPGPGQGATFTLELPFRIAG